MQKTIESKRKRYKKQKEFKVPSILKTPQYIILILPINIIFCIGGFILYKALNWQSKEIREINKNVMKSISPDVKNQLAKQTLKASISATLHVPIRLTHFDEL